MYAVCATVKDGQRYIREWAEHHLRIGFDRVYIFGDKTSGSHAWLTDGNRAVIRRLEDCNIPAVFGFPRVDLYIRFTNEYRDEADRCAFIDGDEFVMLNDGTGPDKLTNCFKRYPAIVLYWKVYGADGHISRPDLPVREACTKTVKWWRYREFKSFVSLKNAGKWINSHHVAGAVNPDFLPVRNMCKKPVYGMAHINRYYTKSREDFADRLRVGTPCYSNRDCDGFFMTNPDMWPVAMELIKPIKNEHFPTTDRLSWKYGIYTTGSGNRVILGRMNRQIITNESRI